MTTTVLVSDQPGTWVIVARHPAEPSSHFPARREERVTVLPLEVHQEQGQYDGMDDIDAHKLTVAASRVTTTLCAHWPNGRPADGCTFCASRPPRFTAYAEESIGRVRHTITRKRCTHGWTLTLRANPIHPSVPVNHNELTGREFVDAIRAQSTVVATRVTPPVFVGGVELNPTTAAADLVREYLGDAWTVVDLGRGYAVELRTWVR